jgi:predicted DNA-binding transcriptional regulator AlpA
MQHSMLHPALPIEGKIRFPTIKRVTGTESRSTIWRWEQAGKFPKSTRITPRLTVWDAAEVREWLADPVGWPNNASSKEVA